MTNVASYAPLPGVAYKGTMQTADIYPMVLGIGGVRTQDYTIPVFADSIVDAGANAVDTAHTIGPGLFSSPAGWLTLILLALVAASVYHASSS